MSVNTDFLTLTWSTSRARDTFGYNRLTLRTRDGARFNTCGGNYDMVGTVIGEWLEARYQDRLKAISARAGAWYGKDAAGKPYYDTAPRAYPPTHLYGLTRHDGTGNMTIDGACGVNSVESIANAIGVSFSAVCNRKGHATGYMVTDYGSAEARRAAYQEVA